VFLSPFAENHDHKIGDECEEFLLRRDFTPDEALGRNPDRKVVGVSFFIDFVVRTNHKKPDFVVVYVV
jgi:hypothetical protein